MYQHLLARAKIDSKAIKMALYGFCISAPLGHTLVGLLQKAFAGKTTTKDKIMQILASNLILAPVQISGAPLSLCLKVGSDTDFGSYTVYLASMAVINGAKSVDEVLRTVKGGFMNVMRVGPSFLSIWSNEHHVHQITWITSPLSLIVAQKYLSPEVCGHLRIKSVLLTGIPCCIALGAFLQLHPIRSWGMCTISFFLYT